MKSGLTISAVGHAIFFAWGIISFAATPLKMDPTESLPVDIISVTDFSKMTAGMKTAPKSETQKPLVEKVAPKNEVKDPAPKVVEKKPEIDTSAEAPPPPTPEPKPKPKVAEAKPPEPKAEKLEKKPDPIAEAIKQEKPDDKPKEKDEAAPKQVQEIPTPQKRPPRPDPKPAEPTKSFADLAKAALVDKRAPQRLAAAGEVLNNKPALGTATGTAAALSQNELDALRAQIERCWNPPIGAADARNLVTLIRIELNVDGTLANPPSWQNRASDRFLQVAAESAMRAVRQCQPYKLPAAKYETWRAIDLNFDPKELIRG